MIERVEPGLISSCYSIMALLVAKDSLLLIGALPRS